MGEGDFLEAVRSSHLETIVAGRLYRLEGVRELPPRVFCLHCGQRDASFEVSYQGALVRPRSSMLDDEGAEGLLGWCPCFFRPIYRPRADLFKCEVVEDDAPALEDA